MRAYPLGRLVGAPHADAVQPSVAGTPDKPGAHLRLGVLRRDCPGLSAREGRYILKYFLVGGSRRHQASVLL
jgi:hypothetical protein